MKSLDPVISSYREPLSYRNQEVSQDLLANIIQTSRVVPYAFYLDPTRYYVITDNVLKSSIWEACFKQPLVHEAPAIIVFTASRHADKEQEMQLDHALSEQAISIEEAERARHAKELHFDISPLGLGWFGKLIGAPFMRLFTTMPHLPAIHKREFLCRQVMRAVMTAFWEAESFGLNAKIVESYDEWKIKKALNIPWHNIVVSVMLVGYAEELGKTVSALSLDEVVHWNTL